MTEKDNSEQRVKFPLKLNLLDSRKGQRPPSISTSISMLSVMLVVIALLLAYAVLPFAMFPAAQDLPNLYSYMADRKAHVEALQNDLNHAESQLARLRTSVIPQAKEIEDQIRETEEEIADIEEAYQALFTYPLWSSIIGEIDRLAPAEVGLTSIMQFGTQVLIEGTADSDAFVSVFTHNLYGSDLFRSDPPYDPVIGWIYQVATEPADDDEDPPAEPPSSFPYWFSITVTLKPVGGSR